jgi:hypothetical protein
MMDDAPRKSALWVVIALAAQAATKWIREMRERQEARLVRRVCSTRRASKVV